MIFFPDVNVWIALASDQHVHNRVAKQWLDGLENYQLLFCRLTELGFLRLLTNSHVMGSGVLTGERAWNLYQKLRGDPRILFLPERAGFQEIWKHYAAQLQGGTNSWTDTYLAAFASHISATLITFDRNLSKTDRCSVVTLSG
jgi:toxin-antitoxin system PIN domain toxin